MICVIIRHGLHGDRTQKRENSALLGVRQISKGDTEFFPRVFWMLVSLQPLLCVALTMLGPLHPFPAGSTQKTSMVQNWSQTACCSHCMLGFPHSPLPREHLRVKSAWHEPDGLWAWVCPPSWCGAERQSLGGSWYASCCTLQPLRRLLAHLQSSSQLCK